MMALISLTAAIIGHSFSVFTRFKGGKGVATTAGGFLIIMPVGTLVSAVAWGLVFFTTRYVSLASILAAMVLPVSAWYLTKLPALVVVSAAMAAFVVVRHRANIRRLINGTENKFVKKPKLEQGDPKP
jgi:acyl phosphate:glycerol-3-phosphate acyltransferase